MSQDPHTRSALAIVVRFRVRSDELERVVELVTENARLSKALEPNCLRFDVLLPEGGASEIVLYEIYRTPEDFADHLTRPHFIAFDAVSSPMIVDKTVGRFHLSAQS